MLQSNGCERRAGALVFCAALTACAAFATEYEWVRGATDWADAASYTNTAVAAVNTVMPGASDDVDIPANCTVTLDCDNAAHLAAVNKIGRIRPMTSTSFFVVKVSDGKETTLNTKVNFDNTANYAAWMKGGIVKRGEGTLILGSNGGNYDYFTDITVEKGTLKLPQETTGSWRYYDIIAVSNGATLFTCAQPNKVGGTLTAPQGLVGEGLVTNDCTTPCFLEMLGAGRVWSHRFDGMLAGSIMLNNARTRFDLTNPGNTFTGGIRAMRENSYAYGGSVIGLAKIGNKADTASSAGKYDTSYGLGYYDTRAWNRNYGAGFMYLGTGETTDKDIYVNAGNLNASLQSEPNFFDGGPHGGLTLTGEFKLNSAHNQVFVFTGSNVNECVVAGPFRRKTAADGTNYNWRIIKKGTGTWRFANVSTTEMEGVFAVENGTLRYDSIAEAGTRCSLGYSTLLLENYIGKIDNSRRVDYAFELGSTDDTDADPIFEYTGANRNWCFSRPIALKGNARLRHSGGGELRLAYVRTLNAAAKMLTLDGAGYDAWLFNVADAYGTLSLTKDGTGAWTIAGTNQIAGSVTVKAGTLNLAHPDTPFTWFRWTPKETCNASGWKTAVEELGLYDEQGNRLNGNLSYNSTVAYNAARASGLAEGEVAMGTDGYFDGPANVVNMFDGDSSTKWSTAHKIPGSANSYDRSTVDNPAAWWSIIMRLPASSAAVASYDILGLGANAYEKIYVPRAFMLEGSLDGANWYVIDDYDAGGYPSGNWLTWRFSGDTWGNPTDCNTAESDFSFHEGGRSVTAYPTGLPVPLVNVTNISVAAGARLAVTGGTLDLPSGIRLTVDGATGAGTLANVVFPENGTLEVVNLPSFNGSVELGVTCENVMGFDRVANWSLVVNGSAVPAGRLKCRTAAGKIVLYRPGGVFVVR